MSRKVKIALAKIGVDVNGEEGQKKVQQVKDTLFGRQTANQAEKGKTAVGESYLYMKEGKNKMNPEEIKEKEEKDFEENPFEYDDWDVEFEPRIDFDIDAPEFDGGFDDDIDKTEVVVKAEVPAEAVESIPEDGKAKIELPIEGEDDEEEAEDESVKNAGNVLNVMSQQSIQLSPDVNVGKASTNAVVSSSVLILFADIFLTKLLS